MRTFSDDKLAFQAQYGAEWFMLSNSPAFRAAMELAARYSPSRNTARIATPAEVLQLGVVFAAQDQGYHSALQTIEGLSDRDDALSDPSISPDYQDEPYQPARPMTPAPEAPAPRKPTPKPQPKKKK